MPPIPAHIFQPAYTNAVATDSNHLFRTILRTNDLYRWSPETPTHLYHCSGDTVVPFENAQVAHSNFVANGSTNVMLIDPSPPGSDHGDGAVYCFTAALEWFDSLRTP